MKKLKKTVKEELRESLKKELNQEYENKINELKTQHQEEIKQLKDDKKNNKIKNDLNQNPGIWNSILNKYPITVYEDFEESIVKRMIAERCAKIVKYQYKITEESKNDINLDQAIDYILKQENLSSTKKTKLKYEYERCHFLYERYNDKLNGIKFNLSDLGYIGKKEWIYWVNALNDILRKKYPNTEFEDLDDKLCNYVFQKGKNKGEICNKINCKQHKENDKIDIRNDDSAYESDDGKNNIENIKLDIKNIVSGYLKENIIYNIIDKIKLEYNNTLIKYNTKYYKDNISNRKILIFDKETKMIKYPSFKLFNTKKEIWELYDIFNNKIKNFIKYNEYIGKTRLKKIKIIINSNLDTYKTKYEKDPLRYVLYSSMKIDKGLVKFIDDLQDMPAEEKKKFKDKIIINYTIFNYISDVNEPLNKREAYLDKMHKYIFVTLKTF